MKEGRQLGEAFLIIPGIGRSAAIKVAYPCSKITIRKTFRQYLGCQRDLTKTSVTNLWRVRVQVELGPNNNYNLFSSDLCDVRSKTESFYKVY